MHSTFFFLKRDYLGIGEGSRGLEWGQRETERRVNLRPGYTTRGSVFNMRTRIWELQQAAWLLQMMVGWLITCGGHLIWKFPLSPVLGRGTEQFRGMAKALPWLFCTEKSAVISHGKTGICRGSKIRAAQMEHMKHRELEARKLQEESCS